MSCEPLLSWKSFPFVERPLVSFLLIMFLIILSFILWNIAIVSWHSPLFYFGGMLLVLGTLLPYFIQTRYELFDERILIHYGIIKIERKYTDFGCFYLDKRGVMLSTFKTPRRLDPFRGQSLRLSATQNERQRLIEILTEKIGKQY